MTHSALPLDQLLVDKLGSGHVYSVGGRVRDEVLADLGRGGLASPDADYLVLSVPYDEIVQRLTGLGSVELVGSSFGVIKFTRAGHTVDIALPRRERSTGPHHRDFSVESAPDIPIEDDLRRRDFRINMMARDLASGMLIDPYGGREDLLKQRLDIVADETFVEDPLRILRGAHFAARFDLAPSDRTLAAMREAAHLVNSIAPERIADELRKLLTKAARPSVGFELLRSVGALNEIMPELMQGWDVEQNEFHRHTVYYHALYACDAARPDLVVRLAALLHDIGKPATKSGSHFYRHEFVGEDMARALLTRLRFPGEVIARVTHLIRHHMFASDDGLTDAAVRRFINRVGAEHVETFFALRRADIVASGLPERSPAELERFRARVHQQLAGPSVFGIDRLRIDGAGVIAVMRELKLVDERFTGDARVGAVLRHCLECVLEDPAKNEAEQLRAIARAFLVQEAGKG
ncbi:MAG: HD domain-containing protein [Candidatus Eremiobacteraeota bacterium]|nr:HD domain-containing protein [Candidatus Eremiobacteraeota bacterium]